MRYINPINYFIMKKITIFLKTLVILPILMLSSCQNEATQLLQDSNSTTDQKTGSPTEEELLKQGWKLVRSIKLDPDLPKKTAAAKNTLPDPIPLTKAHLKDMGYDIETSQGKSDLFGKFGFNNPVGYAHLGLTSSAAIGLYFSPNLNMDFPDNPMFIETAPNVKIIQGEPVLSSQLTTSLPDDVFTTVAYNNTDKETEVTVKYTYKKGHKTTWQRKVMGSYKVGAKTKFNFFALEVEVSAEVMVGGETADGTENTVEVSSETDYKVTVPAHSKVTVKAYNRVTSTTVNYTIPFSLTGNVAVVYNAIKTNGNDKAYIVFPITSFTNFTGGIQNETGDVKAVNYVQVDVIASAPEKLP